MKKALLYIVGILCLQACTEPIEFDLDEQGEPKIAIDAIIDNLPGQDTVIIRKTSSFYEPLGKDLVTGASVALGSSSGLVNFTAVPNKPGYYVSPMDFQGVPGETYTISVLADGINYEATERMPLVVIPDTAFLEKNTTIPFEPENTDDGDRWYSFKVSFQEPVGIENYYYLRYIINGEDRSENLADYAGYVEDTFFSDQYLKNADLGTLYIFPNDTVDFYFGSINKTGYEIWSALVEEAEFRGGFFDGPPANIPSNWTNGALGLFMPIAYSTRKVIAP